MRTIGIKNRNLVKHTTLEEIESAGSCINKFGGWADVIAKVVERLPPEMWDTWEMADGEIMDIIEETINDFDLKRSS